MAQRFAIDGNFTQSFVGTVALNASACPANQDGLASLMYDINLGSVCFTTGSSDFCYEFIFDAETQVAAFRGQSGNKAFAEPGKVQFVGLPGGGESPIGSISRPVTNLDDTLFLLFNSQSANDPTVDLYNYLIQNPDSGSLTLSTTTQKVEFNYNSQITEDGQIAIGTNDFTASLDSSSLTVLTTTSDTPFSHNERICVAVSSQGGGSSTTYQTGSDEVKTGLSNLKIVDYDSNVFVFSDPVTGQLTLQFGSPALPSITSFTIPTTTSQGSDAFNTNRFSGPGSGLFVIDDNYKMILQYSTASTNTFLSASVLGVREGDYETLATSTETDGNITFNISDFNASDQAYFESGSHYFKGAVHVRLEDGSDFTTQSAAVNVTLSKNNPGLPQYSVTFDTSDNNAYVSNTSNGNTGVIIEKGATGSVDYHGLYGTGDNGWTRTSISPDPASPSTLLITTSSTTNFDTITANYSSNGLGDPSTRARTANKSVSRIVSLRYAAFDDGHFTNNTPTEDDLMDILNWTDNGGTVVFQTSSSGQLNNYTFDLTWSGDKYLYLLMDDGITLTEINNDGFGSIGAYTTGTTTTFRYYRSTAIQAGGASKTVAFKLFT